ncbi:hypothetical protein M2333_001587 [Sphingobium sp. B11D3B]|nr:hypothetical protein [Sphingobium sp. B11D3B]
MIRLTSSDLADLARYPLFLQQSALAIWSQLPGGSLRSVRPEDRDGENRRSTKYSHVQGQP